MKKLITFLCLVSTLCLGATRSVVPNADGDGSIGSSNLQWQSGYFKDYIYLNGLPIGTGGIMSTWVAGTGMTNLGTPTYSTGAIDSVTYALITNAMSNGSALNGTNILNATISSNKIDAATDAAYRSGGGTTNHSALNQLDYASAGHTGFQPTIAGTVLTNGSSINGTNILDATISSNKIDAATDAAYRSGGSGVTNVSYATNSGHAAESTVATVSGTASNSLLLQGYTAAQIAGLSAPYYVWGSLAGPVTNPASKLCQFASPVSQPVWTSSVTVSAISTTGLLGYASINSNELPRLLSVGLASAHLSIERSGAAIDHTMQIFVSVYESNQTTLVQTFTGDTVIIPTAKTHLDFNVPITNEVVVTDTGRLILYYFKLVDGWNNTDTIKVYSQDGELSYVTLAGNGGGVFTSTSDFNTHTGLTATAHGGVVLQSTTGSLGVAYAANSGSLGGVAASAFATNNGTVDHMYTTNTNGYQGTEFVSADWVRNLIIQSSTVLYNITNSNPLNINYYTAAGTTNTTGPQVRVYAAVTNNQYLGNGIMSTSRYTQVQSPITVQAYLGLQTGGSRALWVKPEIYYSYDAGTNLLGDYDCGSQQILTTQELHTFSIPFPTIVATNSAGFYIIRKFKVTSQTGNPDAYIWGNGPPTASSISFASTVDSSLGVRGATNTLIGGVYGTYDTVNRVATLPNIVCTNGGSYTNGSITMTGNLNMGGQTITNVTGFSLVSGGVMTNVTAGTNVYVTGQGTSNLTVGVTANVMTNGGTYSNGSLFVTALTSTTINANVITSGVVNATSLAVTNGITQSATAVTNTFNGATNVFMGWVGIGTNAPRRSLEIRSPGTTSIAISSDGTSGDIGAVLGYGIDSSGANTYFSGYYLGIKSNTVAAQSGYASIYTRNAGAWAERMRVDYNGNVGIGTTAPAQLLQVAGTLAASNTTINGTLVVNRSSYDAITVVGNDANSVGTRIQNSAVNARNWNFFSSGGGPAPTGCFGIYDDSGGGTRLVISTNGAVGMGTTSPGYHLEVTGAVKCATLYIGTVGVTTNVATISNTATQNMILSAISSNSFLWTNTPALLGLQMVPASQPTASKGLMYFNDSLSGYYACTNGSTWTRVY